MKSFRVFKHQMVYCETQTGSSKSAPSEPNSMWDIIQSRTSAPILDSSTRFLSEPGTYYGFAAGACTGFALKKIAKAAAFTFGAVFAGFQLAAQTGYVRVEWDKVERDVKKYLPDKPTEESAVVSNAVDWLTSNTGIAASVFTVGFVTGLKMG